MKTKDRTEVELAVPWRCWAGAAAFTLYVSLLAAFARLRWLLASIPAFVIVSLY